MSGTWHVICACGDRIDTDHRYDTDIEGLALLSPHLSAIHEAGYTVQQSQGYQDLTYEVLRFFREHYQHGGFLKDYDNDSGPAEPVKALPPARPGASQDPKPARIRVNVYRDGSWVAHGRSGAVWPSGPYDVVYVDAKLPTFSGSLVIEGEIS